MSEPLIVDPKPHRARGAAPRGLMAAGLGIFTLAGMLWYLWADAPAPPAESSQQIRERLRAAAESSPRGSPTSVDEAAQRAAQQQGARSSASSGAGAAVSDSAAVGGMSPSRSADPRPPAGGTSIGTAVPDPNDAWAWGERSVRAGRTSGRSDAPGSAGAFLSSGQSGPPGASGSAGRTAPPIGLAFDVPGEGGGAGRPAAVILDPADAERERSAREARAVVFDRSAGGVATGSVGIAGLPGEGTRLPEGPGRIHKPNGPDAMQVHPDSIPTEVLQRVRSVRADDAGGGAGAELQSAMLQALKSFPAAGGRAETRQDQRERWLGRQASENGGDVVRGAPPAGRFVLRRGRVIPAVLTRELNSDAEGTVTARASQDVHDADGHLLVPMGSEFIGRHESAVVYGQTRLLAVFTHLRLPDGYSFALPGAQVSDSLGRAGVPGEVDRHFFRSFGAALLLGVLADRVSQPGKAPAALPWGGTGAATAGGGLSATGQVFVDTARVELERAKAIAPTITVPAGSEVNVEVVRDMVFPGPYRPGSR